MEELALYKAYDFAQPWDAPENRKLVQSRPDVFKCPKDDDSDSANTSFVAIVGANTAWRGGEPVRLDEINDPANTILLVEIANSGIDWMEPRDLTFDQMNFRINDPEGTGISSNHADGAHVAFADYHVEFLPDSTEPSELKALLTISGVENARDGGL